MTETIEDISERRRTGVKAVRHRAVLIVVFGLLALFALFVFSLTVGPYSVSFGEAMHQIVEIITTLGKPEDMSGKIIFSIRVPRSIAVMLVGAGLAIAGAVMQAMIHNPLVDPYVTGVSSGASFGVILFTLGASYIGSLAAYVFAPIGAIVGAVCAFMITMLVAEGAGGKAMSYVLGGVIVAAGLSAGTTLILSFNAERIHSITAWMFGSFASIEWDDVVIMVIPIIAILIFILIEARKLNVMLLGEDQARYLGMDSRKYKRMMLMVSAVLTAMCVAYCGVIGFIGLVVPHLCRMVVGGDHRLLIPTSIVVGAVVLLVADIICKSGPIGELPIGAITSVVGVPFFIYLMLREGRRYAM
ncbi:MAG: iron ABC transporter permease [Candidatus Methanomethylophilaceae archaeon]|nr:iron ABC transporter permease [Candidatus Methanomethylophilaceae archaeon]